ncbi:sulfatase family protein [Tautonia sociabilis]|uniref:Sulfatase n=1 Tax=Tautonia sociabilis TaxID=2080755 RepID=A0A432MJ78_9BACT|nr:sulfatase [Tautonia sociabilis]RUL87248.1 sulfatase [Tautonia sociabilis]
MNVIVIACNGLHLGFLGPYGNAWIETPNLDRLASEGVVFDHHYPENLTTLPTRRSWWTGRYGFPDPDQGWTPLRPDEPILPDLLYDRGVRSALISDVPMLRQAGHGFGRGFDEVVWIRGQGYDPYIRADDPRASGVSIEDEPGLRLPPEDDPDRELWRLRWEQYLRNRAVLRLNSEENAGSGRAVRAAIDWLERSPRDASPFVLWLDLFSPHGPWDPPPADRDRYVSVEPDDFEAGEEGDLVEEDGEEQADDLFVEDVPVLIDVPPGPVGDELSEEELFRLRRTYAGAVTALDRQIGLLLDALGRLGRLDDTLVVFTSDQGEPLGEHGFVRRYRPWLYEELVHSPLIVRLPGGELGGRRHQAIVQTVDLLPTILSALGAGESPADLDRPPMHGRDLLELIRGRATKFRDFACMGMDVEEFALRTHYWHLIVPIEADPDDPPRRVELYRKPEDRWEQNDVAERHPDLIEHLELVLRRFVAAVERDDFSITLPLRELALFPPQA